MPMGQDRMMPSGYSKKGLYPLSSRLSPSAKRLARCRDAKLREPSPKEIQLVNHQFAEALDYCTSCMEENASNYDGNAA